MPSALVSSPGRESPPHQLEARAARGCRVWCGVHLGMVGISWNPIEMMILGSFFYICVRTTWMNMTLHRWTWKLDVYRYCGTDILYSPRFKWVETYCLAIIYIYDILLDPNNHIPNTCLDMFKWSCMFSGVFLAIGLLEILHLHMGRCNTLGVIYSGDVVVFPRQVYPLVL